jgi:hypothetical protein
VGQNRRGAIEQDALAEPGLASAVSGRLAKQANFVRRGERRCALFKSRTTSIDML